MLAHGGPPRTLAAFVEENKMKFKLSVLALALVAVLAAPSIESMAAEQIKLITSRTSYMRMDEPPGTIVVGNPSIADVTVNGRQMFIHGRNYGNTNIMIFDAKGNLAREFEVTVEDIEDNRVTAFKGGFAETYACIDDCVPMLKAGDSLEYFKAVTKQFNVITGLATGQQSSDGTDEPPTPPPAQ